MQVIQACARVHVPSTVCALAVVQAAVVLLGTTDSCVVMSNTGAGTSEPVEQLTPEATFDDGSGTAAAFTTCAQCELHAGAVTHCAVAQRISCTQSHFVAAVATDKRSDKEAQLHVLLGYAPHADEGSHTSGSASLQAVAADALTSGNRVASISVSPSGLQIAVAYQEGRIEVFALSAALQNAAACKDEHTDSTSASKPGACRSGAQSAGASEQTDQSAPLSQLQKVGCVDISDLGSALAPRSALGAAQLHWQLHRAAQPGQLDASPRTTRALYVYASGSAALHRLSLCAEAHDSAPPLAETAQEETAQAVPPAAKSTGAGRGAAAAAKPGSASKAGKGAVSAPEVPPPEVEAIVAAQYAAAASVVMRFPSAIVCSAASQDGARLLIALQSGCLVLYSTHLCCTLATSACLPSVPRAVMLGTNAMPHGAICAAVSGEGGALATWNGTHSSLDVVSAPLPLTLKRLEGCTSPGAAAGVHILAQTACGRLVLVDASAGCVTHALAVQQGHMGSNEARVDPASRETSTASTDLMWETASTQVR